MTTLQAVLRQSSFVINYRILSTTLAVLLTLASSAFHLEGAQGPRLTMQRSSGNVRIQMEDLIPGDQYYLAIRTNLTQDIKDYWLPVFEFTPAQSGGSLQFPPTEPAEFDIIVNASKWQGPLPRLLLTNETILSNKVTINAMVTDILPQEVVELWVDGQSVGRSTSIAAFQFDTRRFANGSHTLTLVSFTIPFGTDGDFQVAGVEQREVVFDNEVCFTENFPMDPGSAMHLYTRHPIDYRFQVYKQNGAVIRDKTASQAPGNFDVALDISGPGEPMESGNIYRVVLSWSSPELMASPPLPPLPPTNRPPGWNPPQSSIQSSGCGSCAIEYQIALQDTVFAGNSLLLYAKYKSLHQPYENIVAGLMNSVASEINFSAAVGPEVGREVFGQFPRVWMSDFDTVSVLADIIWWENTHFMWCGHGGPDDFGTSLTYLDTILTTNITAAMIGALLTNIWDAAEGLISAKNPRRYVELNGCRIGTGFFPFAFGIPKIDLDFTVRPRQSFVGWQNSITAGFFARSKYQEYIDYLHQIWDGGMDVGIRDAMFLARQAGGNQVLSVEQVLYGSALTTWLQNPDNF